MFVSFFALRVYNVYVFCFMLGLSFQYVCVVLALRLY